MAHHAQRRTNSPKPTTTTGVHPAVTRISPRATEAPVATGAIEVAAKRVDTLVDRLSSIAGLLENNFDRLLGSRDGDNIAGAQNSDDAPHISQLHNQISNLERVTERLSSEALRIADL